MPVAVEFEVSMLHSFSSVIALFLVSGYKGDLSAVLATHAGAPDRLPCCKRDRLLTSGYIT